MIDIPAAAQVLVQQWAGPSAQVTQVESLNNARARVYRLDLADAPSATAIVKIWQGEDPKMATHDQAAQFCCEQRTYRFLSKFETARSTVPKLLAIDDTAILISDAGNSLRDTDVNHGPYFEQLAMAFADFHSHTSKYLDEFEPPIPNHVGLRFDLASTRDVVSCGADFVLSRSELCCVRSQSNALQDAIARARQVIETPGAFETLLHADVGAARQISFVGENICFYDFEHARIDHALLDLAVPVLGKIEQNLMNGQIVWTGRNFDLSLFSSYRAARLALGEMDWSDSAWNENVGAALVYHVLAFIGELTKIPDSYQLSARFTELVSAILLGLSEHLESIRQYPEFYFFSREFLTEHDPNKRLGW